MNKDGTVPHNPLPSSTGFYWARTRGMKWWNLIVKVWGDAPFLRITVWVYTEGASARDVSMMEIEEFGPFITDEAPDIIGRRKDWT